MWFVAGRAVLERLSSIRTWAVPVTFAALCAAEMTVDWSGWGYVQLPIIALGVWTLWILYDHITLSMFNLAKHSLLTATCRCTFFVYLFHIPLLKFVVKAIVAVCGQSDAAFAFTFLMSPWLFLLFCVPVAVLMRRYVPRLYSVLTGGR